MSDGPGGTRSRAWFRAVAFTLGAAVVLGSGCSCQGPESRGRNLAAAPGVPVIRVKLGDDAASMTVSVAGPWRLTCQGRELMKGDTLGWTDVRVACDGRIVLGDRILGAGPVELTGGLDGSVRVRQMLGGQCRERAYRGFLRITRVAGGLRVVNVLNLEAYLGGVVCNEMPDGWNLEALKAQAVAARTFALQARNAQTRRDFDVYDSVQSQVYGGFSGETAKSRRAVSETWGIVGTYGSKDGRPVLVQMFFHSACGGATASAGDIFGGTPLPPLRGDVPCRYCYRSSKYQWSGIVIPKADIAQALQKSGDPAVRALGPLARIEVAAKSTQGRVTYVRLVDECGKEAALRSNDFRTLVGASRLSSGWFTARAEGDGFVFSGRGNGHGVGLCQYGAQYLAEHGKKAAEILRYYYPGIQLSRAY